MNNNWLDIDVLEDYLDGKLDAQAMHRVEREALEDPFVAEALEGLKATPRRKQTLSSLQKRLHDRVKNQPEKRKMWGITTQRLSVAATATVAFIVVSILFIMRETNRRNQIASQNQKEVIVNLDSGNAIAKQKLPAKIEPVEDINGIEKATVVGAAPALANSSRKADEKIDTEISADVAPTISTSSKITSAVPQKTNQIGAVVKNSEQSIGLIPLTPEVITGKVTAKNDGLALPGVTVRLENSNVATTTDKNGNFTLVADSLIRSNLVVSYIGYKQKIVDRMFLGDRAKQEKPTDSTSAANQILAANNFVSSNPLAISLEPSGQSLAEVVVVGYGSTAKKQMRTNSSAVIASTIMTTKSLPVEGWSKWREYLQKNNRIVKNDAQRKEVVLGFHISNQGAPMFIKVIKGIGKKENAEAIRLLKDGPLWKPVEEEIQVTIEF